MEFDVYCDESRPDLLTSNRPDNSFAAIGSLWLASQSRHRFKQAIHELRDTYKIGGEFKWQKVSPSKIQFYLHLMDWFVDQGIELRFRCILIRHDQIDWNLLENDRELGFYKFYYQVLHHWIGNKDKYYIFCDYKSNRLRSRLETLQNCLCHAHPLSEVDRIQAVRSEESVLIQLTDVLTGATCARLNKSLNSGSAKSDLVTRLESRLGHSMHPTCRGEQKFNIFVINLQGG